MKNLETGLPEVLPTDAAAAALNRAPQTLRKWACLETGPIRPIRINRRLAWRVDDLRVLLDGSSAAGPARQARRSPSRQRPRDVV
ncbi:hypothetical protein BN2475_90117 [Paraburkholderia ribeironis]|uniref:Helix-turn-helix domain-containing protein n=1 Tax=Paraburkholderia ribeironis TaxID=1247936 RepID=A0A1N7RNF1_9BURK|nr:hypothetical protein BN2475_90117 [Paraburkholderia ribeironis]